jgi:hypothetical protein
MSNEFTETNKKYFWYPIVMLVVGIVLGVFLPSPKSSKTKEYPIEVTCSYQSDTYYYSNYMDADSVKGDTIWKDGNKIVNKNIINVTFK